MADALKERLAQEAARFISDHELWQSVLAVVGTAAVAFVAGVTLSWFYKRAEHYLAVRKAVAEQEKIAVDTLSAKIGLAEKRQANRDKHESTGETLGLMLREWLAAGAVRDVDRMNQTREEVLSFLTSSYLPTFRNYSEIQFASLPKYECRMFAQNEVLPFLRTVLNLLELVNHPPILARLRRTPFYLKRTTFCELYGQARRALPTWPWEQYRVFAKLCKGLSTHENEL
jgi:hypothetical protein